MPQKINLEFRTPLGEGMARGKGGKCLSHNMQSRQDKKCTLFVFCRDSRSEAAAAVGSTKFSLPPAFGKDTATNFPVLKVQGKRKEETSQSQFAQLVQNRPKKQKNSHALKWSN